MVLKPEQEVSILISLSQALVGNPNRHEEFLEISEKYGTGPTLTKSVKALRERLADGDIPQSKPEQLAKMDQIAKELESSDDEDESLAGHIMQVIVGRHLAKPAP